MIKGLEILLLAMFGIWMFVVVYFIIMLVTEPHITPMQCIPKDTLKIKEVNE